MTQDIFPVPEGFSQRAWVDGETYGREYRRSISDPEGFWADQAERLEWIKRPANIRDVSYGLGDVHIRWFHDGTLNASVNCLDRHLAENPRRIVILHPRRCRGGAGTDRRAARRQMTRCPRHPAMLLFAASGEAHSHAVALREVLEEGVVQ